mmetsp:Transcript_59988/g.173730  ORF Transcript_59988/g.173730 Transcript_59988/m.173730 type:complete len:452 (+) Transcript_59988:330-1685(+)
MVLIDVRIAQCVNKLAGFQAAHLGHHASQQRVGGDVEGHAQAHVARALVHQARQFPVGDVELAEHVARRQRHLPKVRRVPRGQQNSPVRRVFLDLADALRELIDALAGVVRVHVDILGAKVPPLKAIHRAQVHLLAVRQATLVEELPRAIPVPDVDALVSEVLCVRVSPHEPQELLEDAPPKDALRREQREAPLQVEAHLLAEQRPGADARTVVHVHALVDDLPDSVQVLVLLVPQRRALEGRKRDRWLLQQGLGTVIRAQPLVHDKIERDVSMAACLAHMNDLELAFVEAGEEGIALDVHTNAGAEDARAIRQLDGLFVSGGAADHEDLPDPPILRKLPQSVGNGSGDHDALGEWGDEAGLRRFLRQHDVDAAREGAELFGDGLPRLPAHDDGIRCTIIAWGRHGHLLEVRHVIRQPPWQRAVLADAALRGRSYDHRDRLLLWGGRHPER